jgi:hypothetical protein
MLPSITLTALGGQMPLYKLRVCSVVTVGIFSGRGSLRDQFGRDTERTSLTQYATKIGVMLTEIEPVGSANRFC